MVTALVLAAGLLAPAPALAQGVDWKAASDAFEAARTAPPKPVTYGDILACAAFSSEWSRSASGIAQAARERGAEVHPGLVDPRAGNRVVVMELKIAANRPSGDAAMIDAETKAMRGQLDRFADQTVATALRGDPAAVQGLMNILGTCEAMP
jgi:hypothetical protein